MRWIIILGILTILLVGCQDSSQVFSKPIIAQAREIIVQQNDSEVVDDETVDYNIKRNSRGEVVYMEPYPKSVFYKRLSKNAAVDPKSQSMIATLSRCNAFSVSVSEYSVPIYFAGSKTKKYDVEITTDTIADPPYQMLNVPIPSQSRPDPEDDGHLTVVDLVDEYTYDFWRMERDSVGWEAEWGNRVRLDGDGVYEHGFSSRATGIAPLNGMIWPWEIENGIRHALAVSTCNGNNKYLVAPATESDGTGSKDGIPQGALLRLDPDFDIEGSGLTKIEKVIARALQEYGMYVVDNSGDIELEVVHPYSYASDPYPWTGGNPWYILSNIPVDRLQVMKLGELQERNTDLYVMEPKLYSKVEWNYRGFKG